MPKLTETMKDQLRAAKSDGGMPQHIVATHEPLRGEPFPQLQTQQVITPQPVQFPTIPLPPKAKRGRKPKEQIVNQAPVIPQAKPLKIAVVGTAPSSRMLAPVNDPSWLIWVCSPGNMNVFPRVDAWFEVHGTVLLEPEEQNYAPQYIDFLSKLKCPVFMQDRQVVPSAVPIPKDDLIREFGPYFFTSSFSWMMAYAIKHIEAAGSPEGSEIRLFGIDMASREEYIIQRPGAYHFFQEAARRGIKVSAPNESDIMQPPPLYGYSEVTPYGTKIRARTKELKGRIAPMEQQLRQLQETITYLKGALEDQDYMSCIQGGVQDNTNSTYLESLTREAKTNNKAVAPIRATLNSQG